jgi:chromosome partitioning protein
MSWNALSSKAFIFAKPQMFMVVCLSAPKPPIIVSVCNYKGGVGKTTLAATLAVTLSERFQQKVLLIDADPQANLTEIFLNEHEQNRVSMVAETYEKGLSFDYITGGRKDPLLVRLTENLYIIPSHPKYLRLLRTFVIPLERAKQWREDVVIRGTKGNFNYIFIDLPPQMYGLVRPLIKIADYIITPVSRTSFALLSLRYLIQDLRSEEPLDRPLFLGSILVRFRTVETARIAEYKRRVNREISEAYAEMGLKWELEGKGFDPSFENVLYAHRALAELRALPFNRLGESKLIKLVRGQLRASSEVVPFLESLTKEFIERASKATDLIMSKK